MIKNKVDKELYISGLNVKQLRLIWVRLRFVYLHVEQRFIYLIFQKFQIYLKNNFLAEYNKTRNTFFTNLQLLNRQLKVIIIL